VPDGDHLVRHVCDVCGIIHYQNPKLVTGCILEWQSRILLCRRAIAPRYGLWTLPAGFMENNETTLGAASRETSEEANAEVEDARLFALFSLPHISQVYVMYRGRLKEGRMGAGAETLEVNLFRETDIPWQELAFPVVRESLLLFFADRRKGAFEVHMGDIVREPDRSIQINRL
jgi:ADP-ribose pyrophosphatase YjhB (NUDIX family)